MAADPFDALRLALMEDVLPVGIAVVDRVRRGGPRQVVEAFTASSDPLAQLRQEGDAAARAVRDSLDQMQPGLGNPVVKVQVRDVPPDPVADPARSGGASATLAHDGATVVQGSPPVDPALERRALQEALARMSERLELLERRLGS